MKHIETGIYTSAHNLVLVNKSYDFMSLFLKGNTNILKGSQVNKVHVFVGVTRSLYKIYEMLDEVSKSGKTKIIVHTCSVKAYNVLNTYIKNNNNSVSFRYDFHKNKDPFELQDDSGKLTIYPHSSSKGDLGIRLTMTTRPHKVNKENKYGKETNWWIW